MTDLHFHQEKKQSNLSHFGEYLKHRRVANSIYYAVRIRALIVMVILSTVFYLAVGDQMGGDCEMGHLQSLKPKWKISSATDLKD